MTWRKYFEDDEMDIGKISGLTCRHCSQREKCRDSDREMLCTGFLRYPEFQDVSAMLADTDQAIAEEARRQIMGEIQGGTS